MKNSNDTIGNRTRDLPACSAVPQLIAPPLVCGQIRNKLINCVRNVVSNNGVLGRGEDVKIRAVDKSAIHISNTDMYGNVMF